MEKLAIDGSSKTNTKSNPKQHAKTFQAQLESIHMATPGHALAIVEKYGTWRNLMEAYDGCATEKEKKLMLVGLRVSPIALSISA